MFLELSIKLTNLWTWKSQKQRIIMFNIKLYIQIILNLVNNNDSASTPQPGIRYEVRGTFSRRTKENREVTEKARVHGSSEWVHGVNFGPQE